MKGGGGVSLSPSNQAFYGGLTTSILRSVGSAVYECHMQASADMRLVSDTMDIGQQHFITAADDRDLMDLVS